ncbi:2,3-bisphosphoglycerate-independent phosphoglycerate mutase [Candidatus Woesebacteria bacterium]|nr:2,3-bisphosphoglycerate-independent phosphoglycerate mutase [Candidatus Woesebacteria bacterium]
MFPSKSSLDFVILAVMDGWGLAAPGPGNAISLAKTVNFDRFWASYPHTQLTASGEAVGLPRGEVGNTETGHLNLGAGRIVYQDLARINMSIADGTFYKNANLLGSIEHVKKFNSSLHLMGLIGAGGVHSNTEHLFALIRLAKMNNVSKVYLHLFTDGRDSPTTSAKTYVGQIRQVMTQEGIGQIATIMGRYWAMDRDLRWDRTAKAYFALTKSSGQLVKTPEEAIDMSYQQGKTDEFIEPSIICSPDGKPVANIKDNDAVIFFNFRIDRPRQLSRAFVFVDFSKANTSFGFDPYQVKYQKTHLTSPVSSVQPSFERGPRLNNLLFVMMTDYGKALVDNGAQVAFPPESVDMPLGRVISTDGYYQIRASESEKERFVTFYFNGQQEIQYPGEERIIVSSPKIPTYDQKPEMSAFELTDTLLARLRTSAQFKLVVVNFANADMVGHTGNIGAAAKACEVVDECIGKLGNYVLGYNGALLITSDHGNVEEMINSSTGEIETEHSRNPVPFICVSKAFLGRPQTLQSGILADVAPTILSLLGISVPYTMTGRNLLEAVWVK